MNYDHLIGKILEVEGSSDHKEAKIVYLDFDIGITIVDALNPDTYLRCIWGPVSYKSKAGEEYTEKMVEDYTERFEQIVKDAEEGKYVIPYLSPIEMALKGMGNKPSSENCAFNL